MGMMLLLQKDILDLLATALLMICIIGKPWYLKIVCNALLIAIYNVHYMIKTFCVCVCLCVKIGILMGVRDIHR